MTGSGPTPRLENAITWLAVEAAETIFFGMGAYWIDDALAVVHAEWETVGGK